jgi:hypothetical protein
VRVWVEVVVVCKGWCLLVEDLMAGAGPSRGGCEWLQWNKAVMCRWWLC